MSSHEIAIGTSGNVLVHVVLPPNNGLIYTIGVWDKAAKSWQFPLTSDLVMPGQPRDTFPLGTVAALDGDFFCISAKLIALDGAQAKYWVAFEVENGGVVSKHRSRTFTDPTNVDLVYELAARSMP